MKKRDKENGSNLEEIVVDITPSKNLLLKAGEAEYNINLQF